MSYIANMDPVNQLHPSAYYEYNELCGSRFRRFSTYFCQ